MCVSIPIPEPSRWALHAYALIALSLLHRGSSSRRVGARPARV